jgi:hypothetical protein
MSAFPHVPAKSAEKDTGKRTKKVRRKQICLRHQEGGKNIREKKTKICASKSISELLSKMV